MYDWITVKVKRVNIQLTRIHLLFIKSHYSRWLPWKSCTSAWLCITVPTARYTTGHLQSLAHRSLYDSRIVMLKSVNENECETQTDRQREPGALAEEMGKTWKQMDNCRNEIITHIAMQHTDTLQVAGGRKYRYLLFYHFPKGQGIFFPPVSGWQTESCEILVRSGRRTGGGGMTGMDITWRLIGVSEPCSPWGGSLRLAVAPPSLWQPDRARAPVCLSLMPGNLKMGGGIQGDAEG